jgi:hypothetical protein
MLDTNVGDLLVVGGLLVPFILLVWLLWQSTDSTSDIKGDE